MFTNMPGDVVKFYDKEFTIKRIPIYIGITALTAGLIITDNQTWKASDKFYRKTSFNKNMSDAFVEIGDGKSQFGLAAAFAAYGLVTQDDRSLRTASEVIEAVLTSGAVVQVLKHITGRESPYLSTKPGGAWRFFPNQVEYFKHVPAHDAYPSGHLTTSLSAFVVIAEDYPEAKWIAPVSYGAETLLAVSMVNQGIHWYSDYPLAILLGYTFGKIAARPMVSNDSSSIISDLQILPYIGHIYNGVSLSLNF
jgi:membrane-associated phospholipid phosphatase